MTPDLTFEDVAGNEHALQEMQELVGYLTNPAKYVGQLKSLYLWLLFSDRPYFHFIILLSFALC